MIPTFKRRLKLKNDAYAFQEQTGELVVVLKTMDAENLQDIAEYISQFCTYLKNLSLPVTKRGEGVLNLVKIKEVSRAAYEQLDALVTALGRSDEHERTQLLEEALCFWAKEHESLFNELSNKKDDVAATYSSPKM